MVGFGRAWKAGLKDKTDAWILQFRPFFFNEIIFLQILI
jgi:hypothetical protein